MGVSQAHPAARRRAPRHRRRPPGLRRLRSRPRDYTSSFAAESLRRVIEHLDLGPVHLTGQDIGGVSTFRLAAGHPELVRSYAAIETGLPGFGLETLADVTHGGVWHIGVLAAAGIPKMLLTGRERDFLAVYAYPAMSATEGAISEQDIDEFTRATPAPTASAVPRASTAPCSQRARRSQIVAQQRLTMPVLAVGAGTGRFTYDTMAQVAQNVTEAKLDGIGHLAAIEDPETLAQTLLGFYRTLDA